MKNTETLECTYSSKVASFKILFITLYLPLGYEEKYKYVSSEVIQNGSNMDQTQMDQMWCS